MTHLKNETKGELLGVKGRYRDVHTFGGQGNTKNPDAISTQTFVSEWRNIGDGEKIQANIRFDDNCRNGHQSFAITGETRTMSGRELSGGCIRDEIKTWFPELTPLIKWHLSSQDGPMHYIANTCYHASNRDYNGRLAGEPFRYAYALSFGNNPILHKFKSTTFIEWLKDLGGNYDLEVLAIDHDNREGYKFGPKFTLGGYANKWHECPFDSETEALRFLQALQTCEPTFTLTPTAWGEGKERDFDAARSAAVWPEATDAELSVDRVELEKVLLERGAPLNDDFKQTMESIGFIWQNVPELVESNSCNI